MLLLMLSCVCVYTSPAYPLNRNALARQRAQGRGLEVVSPNATASADVHNVTCETRPLADARFNKARRRLGRTSVHEHFTPAALRPAENRLCARKRVPVAIFRGRDGRRSCRVTRRRRFSPVVGPYSGGGGSGGGGAWRVG